MSNWLIAKLLSTPSVTHGPGRSSTRSSKLSPSATLPRRSSSPTSPTPRSARCSPDADTGVESSRRRQRDLVADAAHELRTPLTSLRTNVDLLARSERTGRPIPAEERAEIIDRLQAQAGEFSDLVAELVVLARDDRELEREDIEVHRVIDRAVRRARSRARDHHFDVGCRPWTVTGDAGALERTVLNLLDNAVKFSPGGSTVRVRSETGWITVGDQGHGLAEEHWAQAFERFWRAPGARAVPGSGLGLAIVADTVAAHGGTVRFETPVDGKGSSVRVELPLT